MRSTELFAHRCRLGSQYHFRATNTLELMDSSPRTDRDILCATVGRTAHAATAVPRAGAAVYLIWHTNVPNASPKSTWRMLVNAQRLRLHEASGHGLVTIARRDKAKAVARVAANLDCRGLEAGAVGLGREHDTDVVRPADPPREEVLRSDHRSNKGTFEVTGMFPFAGTVESRSKLDQALRMADRARCVRMHLVAVGWSDDTECNVAEQMVFHRIVEAIGSGSVDFLLCASPSSSS